ncbi:glycosyltransferase family 9 protein [Desulfolutivibrio sp.]|uniref:glycosyltransferase family 9 protein n=1 Tax=Desulfolutivibrio sp. TaxID=2773296 RepID=UPI002F960B49
MRILVFQMQRMGDLILSFPLFLWLTRAYPGAAIRVVGEPGFFGPLSALGPAVDYVGWDGGGRVAAHEYDMVINLSHRPEAAELAGKAAAPRKAGLVMEEGGVLRMHGDWQLYRASLVRNNRHNRFHWADLNALDVIPREMIAATRWDAPRQLAGQDGQVGVFLGASQPEKRPDAAFWGSLARELARRGLRPVLLGGPAERELGREVKRLCGGAALEYCGRLGLAELAKVLQTFHLLITPDTGPMHLAAWTGCRVLNLSMGPVNPWETGPYQPGHFVLRGAVSCRGCWECSRSPMPCRAAFDPARVAYAAWRMVRGESRRLAGTAGTAGTGLSGMDLFQVARDDRGLYRLEAVSGRPSLAGEALGRFWSEMFGHFFGLGDISRPHRAWDELARSLPRLAAAFVRTLPRLGGFLRAGISGRGDFSDESFWAGFPPFVRPLTGYLHLFLQNGDFSSEAGRICLERVSWVAQATSGPSGLPPG